jgi:hypothetical protein
MAKTSDGVVRKGSSLRGWFAETTLEPGSPLHILTTLSLFFPLLSPEIFTMLRTQASLTAVLLCRQTRNLHFHFGQRNQKCEIFGEESWAVWFFGFFFFFFSSLRKLGNENESWTYLLSARSRLFLLVRFCVDCDVDAQPTLDAGIRGLGRLLPRADLPPTSTPGFLAAGIWIGKRRQRLYPP